MKALVSDTTKKTIGYDEAYHVTIKSYGNNTTIELDSEMIAEIRSLLKLGMQNGAKYWKFVKDGVKDDGSIKWKKEFLEPQQELKTE